MLTNPLLQKMKKNRMSFLDVNIILSGRQIYMLSPLNFSIFNCKPAFSGIYTYFNSFLPSTYKIGDSHDLFAILVFPDLLKLTKFHLELVKLMDVFKRNGYPENFINT